MRRQVNLKWLWTSVKWVLCIVCKCAKSNKNTYLECGILLVTTLDQYQNCGISDAHDILLGQIQHKAIKVKGNYNLSKNKWNVVNNATKYGYPAHVRKRQLKQTYAFSLVLFTRKMNIKNCWAHKKLPKWSRISNFVMMSRDQWIYMA